MGLRGWEQWLDVVLPRDCAGCGMPGVGWCRACSSGLAELRPQLAPAAEDVGLVGVGGAYEGLLQAAVLAHKRREHPPLRESLARLFARALAVVAAVLREAGAWRPPLLLVPVPPSARHPDRVPMVELGRLASRCSVGVYVAPVLVARRRRRPQKGLDAQQRAGNLTGAWRLDPRRLPPAVTRARSATVIVIDDVSTTGASLREAAACLRAGGAPPAASVVLARALGYSQQYRLSKHAQAR